MNCPSCSSALREIHFEGARLHSCDGCGGEFVSPEAMAQVVNTRDEQFTPKMRKALAGRTPVAGVPTDEAMRQQKSCPACGGKTTVINYAVDTGVYADRCDACGGIWLDRDELEHIQIILETAQDSAGAQKAAAAADLMRAKAQTQDQASGAFEASRFSFVNAIVSRLLDAA